MGETSIAAKFVSQKISKIRWQPSPRQMVKHCSTFATGSWDNNASNCISVWQLAEPGQSDGDGEGSLDGEPSLLCENIHSGDITQLVYINQEHILASSSLGSVAMYRHHTNSQTLSVSHIWKSLHHHSNKACPCTSLAIKGEDTFVSVGEDGRLNVVNIEHRTPSRIIDEADSCTLNAVAFLKQSEVVAVNSIGQLKVWDIRQATDQSARVFLLTGERIPLHCVDKHPTQPHIVATGGQDGTLCIWDMRQDKFPVTLLSAHSSDLWELKFHPSHPDNLFSCSEDGSVWHWDRSGATESTSGIIGHKETQKISQQTSLNAPTPASKTPLTSSWLSSEASRQGLEITDLMAGNTIPVNSLDITDDTLLCGTDGEQIYTINNLVLN